MSHLLYTSCTPREVIALAYVNDPNALVRGLLDAAATHAEAADTFTGKHSIASARSLSRHCTDAAEIIHKGRHLDKVDALDTIMASMPLWIPTFNVACNIVGVPLHMRSHIAGRHPLEPLKGDV